MNLWGEGLTMFAAGCKRRGGDVVSLRGVRTESLSSKLEMD